MVNSEKKSCNYDALTFKITEVPTKLSDMFENFRPMFDLMKNTGNTRN